MIYFDNSATSLVKPNQVKEYMIKALNSFGNSDRTATTASLNSSRMIYNTRVLLAKLFNIDDEMQIAFTLNATESLNVAIFGAINDGDHVITTVCEHNSVLRPLYQKNVEIDFLNIDEKGNLIYSQLEKLYKKNTRAIIITHASNVTGNITNLEIISQFAKKYNILLILDSAQTVGILPIDVKKYGIDIMCFSCHKGLLGPQGVGGIYVDKKIKIKPLKYGGSGSNSFDKIQPSKMPTILEVGTQNAHSIAGVYGALEYLNQIGIDNIHKKEKYLAKMFYNGVKDIQNIKFYGDYTCEDRLSIVSLNIKDADSQQVCDILFSEYDICTRGGVHCAPLIHKAFNTDNQGIVRFSFSHFNTEEEIEKAIKAVWEISKRYG